MSLYTQLIFKYLKFGVKINLQVNILLNKICFYFVLLIIYTNFTARPKHKTLYIMGKGDKKSRRGKIIMGSFGVSRPKSSKKSFVKVETAPAEAAEIVKKVAEKPKPEPKPKVAKTVVVPDGETEVVSKPKKTTKKASAKPEKE